MKLKGTIADLQKKSATLSLRRTSPQSSRAASECIRRYGTAEQFAALFSPQHQAQYCQRADRVFSGNAPTMTTLANAYGHDFAETWIECEVKELSEYTGCKDKITVRQTEDLAKIILSAYPYLMATELMLFFWRFKTGRYGRFYGAVDTMVVTTALRCFMTERRESLARLEQEREKARRDREDAVHLPRVRAFRAKCRFYGVDALTLTHYADLFDGHLSPEQARQALRERQATETNP